MAEKRVFSVIPTIGTAGAPALACIAPAAGNRIAPLATALIASGGIMTDLDNFVSGAAPNLVLAPVGSIAFFRADDSAGPGTANDIITITGVPNALVGINFYAAVKTADTTTTTNAAIPGGIQHTLRRTKIIDANNVTTVDNATFVCASAKVAVLDGFTAECDTEYCIKIRYESEVIKQTYGYQDLVKTYTYTTSCCGDDCACPDGDCAELAYGIAKAVNDDPDNLVTAVAETDTAAPGVWIPIVEADFATGILCTDVRVTFTGELGEFFDGCGPNPMVKDFANNDFYIGLTCGFECNGTITDDGTGASSTIIFEEGLGEQVMNLEGYADGYSRKFGIYRIPFPRTVASKLAVAGVGYDIVNVQYNDVHDSANTIGQVASPEKVIFAVGALNAASITAAF